AERLSDGPRPAPHHRRLEAGGGYRREPVRATPGVVAPASRPRHATRRAGALIALALPLLLAALPAAPAAAQRDTLPLDPALRIGTLDNGLRYYVRQNARPERRAELRLVVRAGSILEDDDQLGLAHFVEHMAFNGTRNFPKQE